MKKFVHHIGPLLGLVLFAVACVVLHKELRTHHYSEVKASLRQIPAPQILLALGLTALSYLVLTGYDALALRYVRHPLAYGKIALVSFIAYAFSHNIGMALVSGGSVRYRLYSAWGFSAIEITKVVIFCALTFWLGFFTTAGVVFLVEPMPLPDWLHLPFVSVRPLGIVFLTLVTAWILWGALKKTPLRIRDWEIRLPSGRLLLAQLAFSCLDWTIAGSVLFAVLPREAAISYPKVLSIFLLAQVSGMASQIPGGLGVFEAVILLSLSSTLSASAILGSLLAYRAIYYLLPLGSAATLLGAHEVVQKREGVKRLARIFGQWVPGLVPQVLAVTTFVGGAILLFSGATPAANERLRWLQALLPLPIVEISHFLGSLAGVALLLLAWGLRIRLDAAYIFTAVLLAVGIILSLLKGLDYEEAIALAFMLGALLPCRRYFYRKASLFSERFTSGWVVAIIFVLLGSVWLGIFTYERVEYSGDLWWQFTFMGDAARSLRATVGASVVLLVLATRRLLRPAQPEPAPPSAVELDLARAVIEKSSRASAYLALLGDKALLFNDRESAFIMYGIEGRSWVALGDPVGPEEEWAELAWRFREMADRHGGWTVFYEVGRENLHIYLDLGLTLLKIGEEARVRLKTFVLEGRARKNLRQTCHRAESEGYTFEIIPPKNVSPLLAEMKSISDAWLAAKHTREKRFSIGFFDPQYLQQTPAAVVRKEAKIVAFANIVLTANKEELSLDLMRYIPEGCPGMMEYLFASLMLWGKQEGFTWFNLGMAPLSGLENHALASVWNRLGAFVFHHGEHFYNFQGLRQYKAKFDPDWKPKYLASPGGLALPRILANLASLTSGGLKGVVAK
jgi:phosphatidylglycerol lysyltransferase